MSTIHIVIVVIIISDAAAAAAAALDASCWPRSDTPCSINPQYSTTDAARSRLIYAVVLLLLLHATPLHSARSDN